MVMGDGGFKWRSHHFPPARPLRLETDQFLLLLALSSQKRWYRERKSPPKCPGLVRGLSPAFFEKASGAWQITMPLPSLFAMLRWDFWSPAYPPQWTDILGFLAVLKRTSSVPYCSHFGCFGEYDLNFSRLISFWKAGVEKAGSV